MESLGAVMIEGESYEVVDECAKEDSPSPTPNKSIETTSNVIPEQTANSTMAENDTNNDQTNEQKEMTDEDVMSHLDDIENIVLDMNSFPLPDQTDQTDQTGQTDQTDQTDQNDQSSQPEPTNEPSDSKVIVKQENPETNEEIQCIEIKHAPDEQIIKDEHSIIVNNAWYEMKLAEKEATVKERLSKLARVLGFSYPNYEKWLETVEKVHGTPVCQLLPSKRCCLDKPYTNRWKFVCSRKSVQDSSKKVDSDSHNKNTDTVWHLEATSAWGVNTNNESDFPPFVLRAVKVFKDFLQTTEQQAVPENFAEDISMDIDTKKENQNEGKQLWLWLLVRCNSMDELMLFATGKNISRSTMDRLKQVYESGPGKNCNVKSLYCKSINRNVDTNVTTFLVGSEALDEVVGGIKIQLAPKTNFWSNAAGAENIANAVLELLFPTPKITVLDIGCGIGLIGLMMAAKCQRVIGVDSQSEVEEAEMMCELNNIKNVSFIMGSASEVPNKIIAAVKDQKTYAVINANTNIGRAMEVMMCMRKIPSLKRIAMVTTLTKQSVRAILELARPADQTNGNPFQPVLATVVDTLPTGPHFEVVILMERQGPNFQILPQPKCIKNIAKQKKKAKEQNVNAVDKNAVGKVSALQASMKVMHRKKMQVAKRKAKIAAAAAANAAAAAAESKKGGKVINIANKNKLKWKRPHSPERTKVPPKKFKKNEPFSGKVWSPDFPGKVKKEREGENSQMRVPNPAYKKKMRDQADLRERLSSSRVDADIAQKVKEHQALLKIAKEKLSGPTPTVDISTAKQLQSMLNMVLEQTNKLQNQLPRSVWDRIAPPENAQRGMEEGNSNISKLRYVQETDCQDIVITTANQKFLKEESEKVPFSKRNIPPLEPDMVPVGPAIPKHESCRKSPERYRQTNSHRSLERDRWNDGGYTRRSPTRRPSPMRYRNSPPRGYSPKRPLLSPPRGPCSPPRWHFSPSRSLASPAFQQQESFPRRQFSPTGKRPQQMPQQQRPMSPHISPGNSPPRRRFSPIRRPISPVQSQVESFRRRMSPPTNQVLPFKPNHISPPRGHSSPIIIQFVGQRRQVPSPTRQMPSPTRQMPMGRPTREMIPPNCQSMSQGRVHISPSRRRPSPQRQIVRVARPFSPTRRQQVPSPTRSGDEWDLPVRGTVEQNTWNPPIEKHPSNTWRSDRGTGSGQSQNIWSSGSVNDRFGKNPNQNKWTGNDGPRQEIWCSDSDIWNSNSQPGSSKPATNTNWLSKNENDRWSSLPKGDGGNWKTQGQEGFGDGDKPWNDMNNPVKSRWESNNVNDAWNTGEVDDWNDLPEDAKDPWGDEANLGLKERWMKSERGNTFGWGRDTEQGDSWPKSQENWQNKGEALLNEQQWKNNNTNRKEPRWFPQTDNGNNAPQSSSWQTGTNTGSWQPQASNFKSQRFFAGNRFKWTRKNSNDITNV